MCMKYSKQTCTNATKFQKLNDDNAIGNVNTKESCRRQSQARIQQMLQLQEIRRSEVTLL